MDQVVAVVRSMVIALVDSPDDVKITTVEGQQTVVLEVEVNPRDVGKIIGRQGRIADAIRVIMNSVAKKHRSNCILQIIDDSPED